MVAAMQQRLLAQCIKGAQAPFMSIMALCVPGTLSALNQLTIGIAIRPWLLLVLQRALQLSWVLA
jgi:hypothetical protein